MERTSLDPWIQLPENRAARQAVERVLACVSRRGSRRQINPLFLHGPTGSGKSRLVHDLITELTQRRPDSIVAVLAARDLDGRDEDAVELRQADLVAIEDAQKMTPRAGETLAGVVDRCVSRQRQLVVTATAGPGRLTIPTRLASRLAQGLVVAIEALSPAGRVAFLRQRAPSLDEEFIDLLAQHSAGSIRQLEGTLLRVTTLTEALGRVPTLDEIEEAFRDDAEGRRLTLEQIAQRVGRYFRIEPRDLRSRGRSRSVMLPRQIGMYLARRLTPLSLSQIGAYFGGRDHSTVLHACKKVEEALHQDAGLSGALRELHGELA